MKDPFTASFSKIHLENIHFTLICPPRYQLVSQTLIFQTFLLLFDLLLEGTVEMEDSSDHAPLIQQQMEQSTDHAPLIQQQMEDSSDHAPLIQQQMKDSSDHAPLIQQQMEDSSDHAPLIQQQRRTSRGVSVMNEVASASSKGMKFAVGWNSRGQPVDPNKAKFVSYIGVVTRRTVPISYDNWRKIPDTLKDTIWDDVQVIYFNRDLYCIVFRG